ncbi:MAG: hypothetical protein U5K76_07155 [Woeseiaceae bacterium]|nr:hypothetical protein [Woeseiaceae bacterium]
MQAAESTRISLTFDDVVRLARDETAAVDRLIASAWKATSRSLSVLGIGIS